MNYTINSNEALIVFIDIQEKLVKMLGDNSAPQNAVKIAKTAQIMKIPSVITEQYPDGLGQTLNEIKNSLPNADYVEKTSFSAFNEESFQNLLKLKNRKQIILSGIETHICVLQTAFDILCTGCNVFVVQDATASRSEENKQAGLRRLRHSGIQIITVEMLLFELLKTSKNPVFKDIQALVR